MNLFALAPLLGRRLDDLSIEELGDIGRTLGIQLDVTDELKQAGLALLQGKSIDTVAELVQSPESVAQLVAFLKGGVLGMSNKQIDYVEVPEVNAVKRHDKHTYTFLHPSFI